MDSLKPVLKAVVAFFTPAAVIIGSSVLEASDGGTNITQAEWITALVAAIVASGAVWAVPNKDPKGLVQDESVQPPNKNF